MHRAPPARDDVGMNHHTVRVWALAAGTALLTLSTLDWLHYVFFLASTRY
jgi:hypothetical protein